MLNLRIVLAGCVAAAAVAATPVQAAGPGPIEDPPRVSGGILVYDEQHSGRQQIHTILDTGLGATQVALSAESDFAPAWSPDGRRIAFARGTEIWVMDRDGTDQTHVTSGVHPAWSPDGKRIAFHDVRMTSSEIYTIAPDGSNEVRLTNNTVIDAMPAWSPDSQQIAWERGSAIFVMNADGTAQRQLTNLTTLRAETPDWSPDGRTIAFAGVDLDSVHVGIYTVRASDGAGLAQITSGADHTPAWSPNGQKLAFVRGPQISADILTIPATGGATFNVTASRTRPAFRPDWIRSGEMIAR